MDFKSEFVTMKKTIFLINLLLFSLTVFSQNSELSFRKHSRSNPKGFKIKIAEKDTELKMVIRLIDSVSNEIEKDKKYIRLNKKIRRFMESKRMPDINLVKSTVIKLNEIEEKYLYCKKDSLIINKSDFIEYTNSYLQILNSPMDVLEYQKNTIIVLDSNWTLTFITKSNSKNDMLNMPSPNEKSYPILIGFLKKSFELYRSEKKNDFLNKEYTFKY